MENEGTPVSMACRNREMRNVCGISMVYTLPYLRYHGFASACVAQLSRQILSEGFTECALYTNLGNPISNSIYRKIGYIPVCDMLDVRFSEITLLKSEEADE